MKFAHDFLKFCGEMPKRVLILQVLAVRRRDISEAFVKYDTEYREGTQNKFFPLSSDEFLTFILMVDEKRRLLCTMRNSSSMTYWKEKEGKWESLDRG